MEPPASYPEEIFRWGKMVRDTGFEPVTPTVSRWCSTTELTARTGLRGWERKAYSRGAVVQLDFQLAERSLIPCRRIRLC